ncbi:MBL fold metallo-hydrolase [Taklimakanibacter lacteus]|uniref:MBL fold metallo-hydrolase n=1 Tax=Taklimakanibacter lacteus TaxID=2268456 RepID=UPI000E670135
MRPPGDKGLSVRFWGVRGSIPTAGPDCAETGGNTACVEIRCGQHVLLFDAGTGIREAGIALTREGIGRFDILLSHSHYDHVIGLPFFQPLFDPRARCTIWSGHMAGGTTRAMVADLLKPPFFPAGPAMFRAGLSYEDFRAGDVIRPAAGIAISTAQLDHPGGVIGYRVEFGGRVITYLTDTGTGSEAANRAALRLADQADMVIYDCMYTEEEANERREFGHSTWMLGAGLCHMAKARQLAMFHHAPGRSDAEVSAFEAAARSVFAGAFAAREGMKVSFPALEVAAL